MDGSIPLMHASGSNMEIDIIELLTHNAQGGLLAKDQFGLTALHYSCYTGYFDIVRYITDINPDTSKILSSNQGLPIHDAIENATGEGLDIIELLVKIYPGCISIGDENGALPLHRAARSCPLHVVEFLYNAYNNAIFTQDKEGLLPMHYCSERIDKTNLEVMDYILNLNPSGQAKTIAEMNSPTKRSFFSSASLKNLFTSSPKKEEIKPTNKKQQKRKSMHTRN
jgi:ankyrin repeat protein